MFFTNFADDFPLTQNIECDCVALPALHQSLPKLAPEPQLTISGCLPCVSSNPKIEACAKFECKGWGKQPASCITLVRPPSMRV